MLIHLIFVLGSLITLSVYYLLNKPYLQFNSANKQFMKTLFLHFSVLLTFYNKNTFLPIIAPILLLNNANWISAGIITVFSFL